MAFSPGISIIASSYSLSMSSMQFTTDNDAVSWIKNFTNYIGMSDGFQCQYSGETVPLTDPKGLPYLCIQFMSLRSGALFRCVWRLNIKSTRNLAECECDTVCIAPVMTDQDHIVVSQQLVRYNGASYYFSINSFDETTKMVVFEIITNIQVEFHMKREHFHMQVGLYC